MRIATLSVTRGEENEQNKYVGHASTIMRFLTSKEGDLMPYFKKIDKFQNGNKGLSINQILIGNHEQVADRGSVKRHLP